jgi:hypothetical protein
MKARYLEMTYRKGQPFAGYLYLPRPAGAKAASTESWPGSLRVDFDQDGRALGIELLAPSAVSLAEINRLLADLDQPLLSPEEWAPVRHAA